MDIRNFKAKLVEYNRNGICGRSFYHVGFSCSLGSQSDFKPNMLALMPADALQPDQTETPVECFVLDMDDLGLAWRGDTFAPYVRAAILALRNNPSHIT